MGKTNNRGKRSNLRSQQTVSSDSECDWESSESKSKESRKETRMSRRGGQDKKGATTKSTKSTTKGNNLNEQEQQSTRLSRTERIPIPELKPTTFQWNFECERDAVNRGFEEGVNWLNDVVLPSYNLKRGEPVPVCLREIWERAVGWESQDV